MKKIINYIKKNGIKRAFEVIWIYKIEIILEKIINIFTKNKPLKNTIMIESHNDFDCNGGAFYDYLIKNKYNKNYKIVWLVRKKVNKKLPYNVECVPLYGPSFRKAYHMCTCKYMTYDCEGGRKVRKDQIIVFCSHGGGGLKSVKGKVNIPSDVNYILSWSKEYMKIQAKQLSLNDNDERLVFTGFPNQDVFFNKSNNEFKKISNKKYNKVIIWMPTFRKGGGYHRNDSERIQKIGIPLFTTKEELLELNNYLEKNNNFMIIKIHPKQDISNFSLSDLSNIAVLTGEKSKKLKIDIYNLVKYSDALISDYSGIAFDYLQLNKPIAYVFDDINEYKLGFVVEDIHTLVAGHEIYSLSDFYSFIDDVSNNNDKFSEKRIELRDYIFCVHDGKSSERLAKLLKL